MSDEHTHTLDERIADKQAELDRLRQFYALVYEFPDSNQTFQRIRDEIEAEIAALKQEQS